MDLAHNKQLRLQVILDDFSHYVWTFPLRHKSDVLPTIISFHAFVNTQFQHPIMCVQTDNGKEFDNSASRVFYAIHGIRGGATGYARYALAYPADPAIAFMYIHLYL